MSTIFIGWGGNEALADELEKTLKSNGHDTVRGGGGPKQMFVGDQIIKQMNSCDRAILLVEDKKEGDSSNRISTNLMYEWGYLVGYRRVKHIYVFMIDKKTTELPSDLHGVWADEVSRKITSADGVTSAVKDDKTLADEIYKKFVVRLNEEKPDNYFEIIDKWPYISRDLENYKDYYNTTELAEHIVLGCLAAYYYNDNERFRSLLNRIESSGRISEIVSFAKIYVDVFINSGDMSGALSNAAFDYAQSIRYFLEYRKREMIPACTDCEQNSKGVQSYLDDIIDVLCYDLLGLINVLYLKNDNLSMDDPDDVKIIQQCHEDACTYFNMTLEKIETLEDRLDENNTPLIRLLRSYIHNDIAHLYKDMNNNEAYIDNLNKSVSNRSKLYEDIHNAFSRNTELQNKIQQEYFIALSEQCIVQPDIYVDVKKRRIASQYGDWREEEQRRQDVAYTNILLDRLSKNIEKFSGSGNSEKH